MPNTLFKIVVCENGHPSYLALSSPDQKAIEAKLVTMIGETYGEEGKQLPVFAGTDDLVVLAPDCSIRSVWNRENNPSRDYSYADFSEFLETLEKRKAWKFVGFQITDSTGANLQGRGLDPFGLKETDILVGEAVLVAKEWAGEIDDVFISEVFSDPSINWTKVAELTSPGCRPSR